MTNTTNNMEAVLTEAEMKFYNLMFGIYCEEEDRSELPVWYPIMGMVVKLCNEVVRLRGDNESMASSMESYDLGQYHDRMQQLEKENAELKAQLNMIESNAHEDAVFNNPQDEIANLKARIAAWEERHTVQIVCRYFDEESYFVVAEQGRGYQELCKLSEGEYVRIPEGGSDGRMSTR